MLAALGKHVVWIVRHGRRGGNVFFGELGTRRPDSSSLLTRLGKHLK